MVQFRRLNRFARACFSYGLNLIIYMSTKILYFKVYDGLFKDTFESLKNEFEEMFNKKNITYEHRLTDDMVACAMK